MRAFMAFSVTDPANFPEADLWTTIGGMQATGVVQRCEAASVDLLQLRILQLGLFEGGDIRVSVFPELKKLQIGMAGLGFISGEDVGTAKLQPCQGT